VSKLRFKNINFYTYKLPLSTPVKWGEKKHVSRAGIILCFTLDDGRTIYSETAPLPLFSEENLLSAHLQLKKIKPYLLNLDFSQESWQSLLGHVFMKEKIRPYPSVHFGLESAFFNIFSDVKTPNVLVSALLDGNFEDILTKAETIRDEGYLFAKLKLSQFTIHQSIDLAQKVLEIFNGQVALRLDVNRCWDLEQALLFGNSFFPNSFDFIEEPLSNINDLGVFYEKTKHPIALDEHLREIPILNVIDLPFAKALILKPTLQGGISICQGISELGYQRGIRSILSSSYESNIGIRAIAKLSQTLPDAKAGIGIDTMRCFDKNLIDLNVVDGSLKLDNQPSISTEHLLPLS